MTKTFFSGVIAATFAAAMLLAAVPAFAAGEGWTESLKEAQAASKASGKPILANFTGSDWCPWCIKLEKEVFSTPEFKKWASEKVVLLVVDFPHKRQPADLKQQNKALQEKFGVKGYPTVIFMDSDGNKLGQSGYFEGGAENWVKKADKHLGNYHPKAQVGQSVEMRYALDEGVDRAKEAACPLMLIVTPAANASAVKNVQFLVADKEFVKLANSRFVLTWLKDVPAKGSDEEKALADFKKQHKITGLTFAALLELDQEKPLYQVGSLPPPKVIVTAVEKALPRTAYNGGWLESVKDAQAIAAKRKKPTLLYFTSGGASSLCVKLDSQVLSSDEFRKHAQKNLVLVKLDFTKSQPLSKEIQAQNDDLAKKYEATVFPTVVLLDADGKLVDKLTYKLDGPAPFIEKVKNLIYGDKKAE